MANRKITNIFSLNPVSENLPFSIQKNEVLRIKKLSYKKKSGFKRKPWRESKGI